MLEILGELVGNYGVLENAASTRKPSSGLQQLSASAVHDAADRDSRAVASRAFYRGIHEDTRVAAEAC